MYWVFSIAGSGTETPTAISGFACAAAPPARSAVAAAKPIISLRIACNPSIHPPAGQPDERQPSTGGDDRARGLNHSVGPGSAAVHQTTFSPWQFPKGC